MAAVADGAATVDGMFEEIMDFCLQCRACETACPSLVPFGRAMEGARTEVTAQHPTVKRRLRHLVVGRLLPTRWVVRLLTRLAAVAQRLRLHRWLPGPFSRLSGLRPLSLVRPPLAGSRWPARTEPIATVGLLAGCVMEPWFPQVHEATVAVLRRAGYDVVVPSRQVCCGALAAHDGAAAAAGRLAERNVAAFADCDIVVANAAGCSAHVKEYGAWTPLGDGLASKTFDVTEIVATSIGAGRLPTLEPNGATVAVQDPCHLRHAQKITTAPRTILMAAGLSLMELDDTGACCGAAGLYSITHPSAAAKLGKQTAKVVEATGAGIVASANPGCEIQLRSYLDRRLRIAHPVELYWEALIGAF